MRKLRTIKDAIALSISTTFLVYFAITLGWQISLACLGVALFFGAILAYLMIRYKRQKRED